MTLKISREDGPSEVRVRHGTILVVDDEEIVCESCALLLSEHGHEVSRSQDPNRALAMASEYALNS